MYVHRIGTWKINYLRMLKMVYKFTKVLPFLVSFHSLLFFNSGLNNFLLKFEFTAILRS